MKFKEQVFDAIHTVPCDFCMRKLNYKTNKLNNTYTLHRDTLIEFKRILKSNQMFICKNLSFYAPLKRFQI